MTDSAGLRLIAISSEIGRGHPSYLDSVLLAFSRLPESGQEILSQVTLDQVCSGTSKYAWNLARSLYHAGAQGGIRTGIYNRLRKSGKPSPLQLAVLGSSLRKRLAGFTGICLVEHPLVAHILAPVCRVAYLHAEIAAPPVAAVPDAWRTFAPLESTASGLQALGVKRSALSVTGLVIEPELVRLAESAFKARLRRLNSDTPLAIGFFTSGAYPRPHVRLIVDGVRSCLDVGHRVIVFAGTDPKESGRLHRRLPASARSLQVIVFDSRRQETTVTAETFPQLDVMVAAAHERTIWAVGLGLPMFVLLPHIGPFAPLNCRFAEEQGVCLPVTAVPDAERLGLTVSGLRRAGRLRQMAESGFGRHPTDGAEAAARALLAATA